MTNTCNIIEIINGTDSNNLQSESYNFDDQKKSEIKTKIIFSCSSHVYTSHMYC